MQKKRWLAPGLLFLLFFSRAGAMEIVDNQIYAALLKKHVTGKTVDYDGFKQDERLLDAYLSQLSTTRADTLSPDHKFAFYINAYNAFTIKLVLTRYPGINSIKEIGNFFSNPWSRKFIALEKKTVSLDYIEHKILRPEFKDPRVHFAVNCASKGCPRLRDEPYEGDILDDQLDAQAREFINDERNTFIKADKLFISKIFKWFEDDFSGNPLAFIRQYASKDLGETLNASGKKVTIHYLDYDWSLNR